MEFIATAVTFFYFLNRGRESFERYCVHTPPCRPSTAGCESCPRTGGSSLLQLLDTERFASFVLGRLPLIELPKLPSILISREDAAASDGTVKGVYDMMRGAGCNTIVSALASKKDGHCIAYASVASGAGSCAGSIDYTFNLVRHTFLRENSSARSDNVGFFEMIPQQQHRNSLAMRAFTLFKNLDEIKREVTSEISLRRNRTSAPLGGPVVVMVVNEGDLVLLLNFACSEGARMVSGAPIIVFTNSPAVKAVVDSMDRQRGSSAAMGCVCHHSFLAMGMGDRSSESYLDATFGDVMWFKAMAALAVAEAGFDFLFQDADVVWFRSPLEYFATASRADVYFSDNGLRTMRSAPTFANSGVYFVRSNPRSRRFLQSVLLAYDSTALTGSHQAVFNEKLAEAMELQRLNPQPLPASLFPHGLKVVRDRAYMLSLRRGLHAPLLFHMCWTANKEQKLANFRSFGMLYLSAPCETAARSASSVLKLGNIVEKCCQL